MSESYKITLWLCEAGTELSVALWKINIGEVDAVPGPALIVGG